MRGTAVGLIPGMGIGVALSLEVIKASLEPTLLGGGCACEMNKEQSPASCSLGDSGLFCLPLKNHSSLQKGLQQQ